MGQQSVYAIDFSGYESSLVEDNQPWRTNPVDYSALRRVEAETSISWQKFTTIPIASVDKKCGFPKGKQQLAPQTTIARGMRLPVPAHIHSNFLSGEFKYAIEVQT